MANRSLWPLPAMAWISIELRASASTSFLVKVLKRGARFDAATRRSDAMVRDAAQGAPVVCRVPGVGDHRHAGVHVGVRSPPA